MNNIILHYLIYTVLYHIDYYWTVLHYYLRKLGILYEIIYSRVRTEEYQSRNIMYYLFMNQYLSIILFTKVQYHPITLNQSLESYKKILISNSVDL